MKLLIDMNLSPDWVTFLDEFSFAALHWSTIGAGAAFDDEIMSYAAAHDLVVLTQDLDFGILLALTGMKKPSVIQLRTSDTDPKVTGHAVIDALLRAAPDLERGALLTIDTRRTRIRLLPFSGF
jgi:predicted nuclease of predicted toxin-antitoxin system